jgi:hypothetical protein
MRQMADPPADDVVRTLYAEGQADLVSDLFRKLVESDDPIPPNMPPIAARYFEETAALPSWADHELISRGAELFSKYGAYMVSGLFCSSLPQCYADAKGAQVLIETSRLTDDVDYRILETAQFVFDVLDVDGLGEQGRGIRTAQKVRLMHAAIRNLIAKRGEWDSGALGEPINQEDLALTLGTFSIVILEALDALHLRVPSDQQESFLHLWKVVGHLLGIQESLLPLDVADARDMMQAIRGRQFARSDEGVELTRRLVGSIKEYIPGRSFDGYAPTLIRHLVGRETADLLGVEPRDWTRTFVGSERFFRSIFRRRLDRSWLLRWITWWFNRRLMVTIAHIERGGKKVQFRIPTSLARPR